MNWMIPGWRDNLTAACEAASRLGAEIAVAQSWPDQWSREWAETVSEVYDQVIADRGLVADIVRTADQDLAEAKAFWKGVAAAALLDSDPKSGLGRPPDGYGDLYLVALQAAGAVQSKEEAEKAAGLWAQVSGAAVASAQDLRAIGQQIPEAAKGLSSGAKAIGLAIGLYALSKIL